MKYRCTGLLFLIFLFCSTSIAQSQSRDELLEDIQAKRAELQALEKQFLEVTDEDRLACPDLLRQPGTGWVRLLPREVYDSEVYQKNSKLLSIRGGGAYYSFTRLTHEYGYGSDIELDSGFLSVGFAGVDFGIMRQLGDIPLEDFSLQSPAAHFISVYNPPTSEAEARIEQRRFATGTTIDETTYRRRLPVVPNSSFLLRSISYDRTDVLVAVRVIRKDSDGSVILAWKLLKNYSAPQLARTTTN